MKSAVLKMGLSDRIEDVMVLGDQRRSLSMERNFVLRCKCQKGASHAKIKGRIPGRGTKVQGTKSGVSLKCWRNRKKAVYWSIVGSESKGPHQGGVCRSG